MSVTDWHGRARIDPLIPEARRRQRRRQLAALIGLAVIGGAIAGLVLAQLVRGCLSVGWHRIPPGRPRAAVRDPVLEPRNARAAEARHRHARDVASASDDRPPQPANAAGGTGPVADRALLGRLLPLPGQDSGRPDERRNAPDRRPDPLAGRPDGLARTCTRNDDPRRRLGRVAPALRDGAATEPALPPERPRTAPGADRRTNRPSPPPLAADEQASDRRLRRRGRSLCPHPAELVAEGLIGPARGGNAGSPADGDDQRREEPRCRPADDLHNRAGRPSRLPLLVGRLDRHRRPSNTPRHSPSHPSSDHRLGGFRDSGRDTDAGRLGQHRDGLDPARLGRLRRRHRHVVHSLARSERDVGDLRERRRAHVRPRWRDQAVGESRLRRQRLQTRRDEAVPRARPSIRLRRLGRPPCAGVPPARQGPLEPPAVDRLRPTNGEEPGGGRAGPARPPSWADPPAGKPQSPATLSAARWWRNW